MAILSWKGNVRILAVYELKMSKNDDTPDVLLHNFVNNGSHLSKIKENVQRVLIFSSCIASILKGPSLFAGGAGPNNLNAPRGV